MDVLSELRHRSRHIIGPILGISLVVYFAYHLVQGDRGLLAMQALQGQLREAKEQLAEANAKRDPLAHKVQLLRGDRIDRDMLDEQVRAGLNLAAPGEIVVFLKTKS